jgi:hypothetical protein
MHRHGDFKLAARTFGKATSSSTHLRPDMIGIAPPPGSIWVLDRGTLDSDSLIPCTPDLCPYSVPYRDPVTKMATVSGFGAAPVAC